MLLVVSLWTGSCQNLKLSQLRNDRWLIGCFDILQGSILEVSDDKVPLGHLEMYALLFLDRRVLHWVFEEPRLENGSINDASKVLLSPNLEIALP